MKQLRGTDTAENLLKAFAGESQARNRYTYYADKAKEEGYMQIANVFLETARNEREHARRFFKFLIEEFEGENIAIHADYPVGLGTTQQNLQYAAAGERDEWENLYPRYARIAEEESFRAINACFTQVAKVEVEHEARYLKLLENIEQHRVFEREEETEWKCENCGYIHRGKTPPKICPTCLFPSGYFEIRAKNY